MDCLKYLVGLSSALLYTGVHEPGVGASNTWPS